MSSTPDRRLSVFFESGGVRYLLQALSVIEVAQPDADDETLRGHLGLRDLSVILGGEPEVRPGTALVLDTSPTRAIRVASVAGVFDCTGLTAPALPRRLIPLVSPAVRGALVRDGVLSFELELDAVVRGLPRQSRRPERFTRPADGPCLVIETAGELLGVPLPLVRQVVTRGPGFNRAPSAGALAGALFHRDALYPCFCVGQGSQMESFAVILVLRGEGLALSAERVDGVRPPERLQDVVVLDLERMFS